MGTRVTYCCSLRQSYDAELRPELMRRAIAQIHDHAIDVDVWKIEGVDAREDAEC